MKSRKRQEEMAKLKREIANVGPATEEPKARKRVGSALEELRAGYQPRVKREKAVGKEGKRQEMSAMKDHLSDFRSRLSQLLPDDDSSDDEGKRRKAEEKRRKEEKETKASDGRRRKSEGRR